MNFLALIEHSDTTKLAKQINSQLLIWGVKPPEEDELFDLVKGCSSPITMAHTINKFYVSLLHSQLLFKLGRARWAIEKLLKVEYSKAEGHPEHDYFSLTFLHTRLKNPSIRGIEALHEQMLDYCFTLCDLEIDAKVTFTIDLAQSSLAALMSELEEEKLMQYICPLTFPTVVKHGPNSITKGYLIDIGAMRKDDLETNNRLGFVERTLKTLYRYNQYTDNTADFLIDYFMINLSED